MNKENIFNFLWNQRKNRLIFFSNLCKIKIALLKILDLLNKISKTLNKLWKIYKLFIKNIIININLIKK